MSKIAYIAHDLSDPSVARRIATLQRGGAELRIAGFRRSPNPVESIEGLVPLDLGQTYEKRLLHRAMQVGARIATGKIWSEWITDVDVIIARNLEMCAIARSAKAWSGAQTPLIYECLDIHPAVLKRGLMSKALRHFEKSVLRRSKKLFVSSPAFIDNYFSSRGVALPPVILIENKMFDASTYAHCDIRHGRPWIIAWCGLLRCSKSFEILMSLVRQRPDLIKVELWGTPTAEIRSLIEKHLPLPGMVFHGKYRYNQLADIYGKCHFVWCVDYFEEGRNSDWLLPNRLYEGSYYRRVAIARSGTQIAEWLSVRNTGLILSDVRDELASRIQNLNESEYSSLASSMDHIPKTDLAWDAESCEKLVADIML